MAPEATSEHLVSKNFLGEHPPRPPLVLPACLFIYAYIHIRHRRNPPSKNPGYGPDHIGHLKGTPPDMTLFTTETQL